MSKSIFHDVEQNTEEWFDMRVGKVTSSKVGCIMAHYPKPFGDPANRYARKLALERFLNKRDDSESYTNAAMQRGHDLEPIARELYEYEKMVKVTNGGFWENGNFGDSPDGKVKDGVIEIKSVCTNTHWERIEKGGFDSAYKWQIHFHIWVTDSKFCDFISYCPEFTEDRELYIFRVERDEELLTKMILRTQQFEGLIEKYMLILQS